MMDRLKQLLADQPALLVGVVEAFLAMLMAFGIDLSVEQVGTIMAFLNMVGAVVIYLFVKPMSKVRLERERANRTITEQRAALAAKQTFGTEGAEGGHPSGL